MNVIRLTQQFIDVTDATIAATATLVIVSLLSLSPLNSAMQQLAPVRRTHTINVRAIFKDRSDLIQIQRGRQACLLLQLESKEP